MKYSALFFTALSLFSAFYPAHPTPTRRNVPSDIDILNFRLTLELLASIFYRQGVQKYTPRDFAAHGFPASVHRRFQIAARENAHIEILTAVITTAGAKPFEACEYNFPDEDVMSFVKLNEIIEGVAVSAYNIAAITISNEDYVTPPASVLGMDARHNAWVNSATLLAKPWSTALDVPLTMSQLLTLASGFITACPVTNTALTGIHTFPSLDISASARPGHHAKLIFPLENANHTEMFAAFLTGGDTEFAPIVWDGEAWDVRIPSDLDGMVYVIVVDAEGKVDDESTIAGPAILQFGFDLEGQVTCSVLSNEERSDGMIH